MEGTKELSGEETTETRRRDDEARRWQSEERLGDPESSTEGARELSEEEIEETRRQEDEELRDELRRRSEEILQQIETAKGTSALPAGFRRAVTWGGCALASVLGLFLVSQTLAVVASIQTLPVPFDWIVGAVAVLCAGILGWLIVRLVWMLVRLRRNPSVNLLAIQALQERQHLQNLAAAHAEQAKHELRNYLAGYRLDDEARRRLMALELTEDEYNDLDKAKRFLLAEDQPMPPDEWLSAFRGRFQSILDRVAAKLNKRYASQVGAGTALAPIAVIDKAVVLYSCAKLIKDLAFLYGLRPSLGQTAIILTRSITQIYLGGLMQGASEAAVGTLWREVSEDVGETLTQIAGVTLAAALPKVAEGIANGVLISRLGKRTISFLQPVRPAK